ncbi:molybdopterin molybdotransferase MoeA [Kitasatospora sp. NPDC048365]|uniref:molybdopterin molybdotransferase MoeA n=1 Tax=Kitasatospora sp. NPDC048365 TaxID=3364050 RepID=UPI00372225E3
MNPVESLHPVDPFDGPVLPDVPPTLRHCPWPQARQAAERAAAGPLTAREETLAEALGRTLAEPLTALTDLPAFDTSAMDGWAVAGPGPWRLAGRVLAGQPAGPLADGEAVEIATGAQLPSGATGVLRREHGRVAPPAGPSGPGGPGGPGGGAAGEGTPPGFPAEPEYGSAETGGRAVAGPGAQGFAGRGTAGAGRERRSDGSAGAAGASGGEPAAAVRPGGGAGLLYGSVGPGQDVRPRGQECRRGEELLPAGTEVTAVVLGLAAAAGHDTLPVRRRPTVELLVLGDELQESGVPAPGRVRDALGPLLPPLLAAAGAEVIGRRCVRDDFGLLRDAIRHSPADVVLTTGGTAAGPVDFLHAALEATGGHLLVDGVAVRPGHPMLLARLPGGRHLVGLPGNPLAAVAGTVTLALPLLHALSGRPASGDGRERAERVAAELPGHPRDTRLVPVVRRTDGAVPLPFDGPAMLRGLALAEALAVVPPGGVPSGGRAELLPLH